jgi:drug/metabolite transporter (DMT)-like permease
MTAPSAASDEPAEHDAARAAAAGRRWVACAAILWSLSGLFAKAPVFDEWPVESRGALLAFWRALFAGLCLLPFARSRTWTPRLIPLVGVFATMNVTYLSAMTLTSAANAIWLQSTAPFWVLVVGTLLMGERVARADLVPLLFAMAGVATILTFELNNPAPAGIFCGLGSGLAYAMVVLLLRHLRAIDSVWLVIVVHLATALLLLPYVVWTGVAPRVGQLPVLVAFGVLQMGLPYLCFARGLRTIGSQEATAIGLLEPLLLPVWVYFAWGQAPDWWTVVGASLIFAGLLIRYGLPALRRRNDARPATASESSARTAAAEPVDQQ